MKTRGPTLVARCYDATEAVRRASKAGLGIGTPNPGSFRNPGYGREPVGNGQAAAGFSAVLTLVTAAGGGAMGTLIGAAWLAAGLAGCFAFFFFFAAGFLAAFFFFFPAVFFLAVFFTAFLFFEAFFLDAFFFFFFAGFLAFFLAFAMVISFQGSCKKSPA